MFWRRKTEEDLSGAVDEEEATQGSGSLAPVRIFTLDAVIDGFVRIGGQRLSDVLNVEDLLSVSPVPTEPMDSQWFVVEREHMLAVVPPTHTSDRNVRLHRVRRRVVAESGHYTVRGFVHMIAGIDLDPMLARTRQHFLPITDAWVTSSVITELNEEHPALLLNVAAPGRRIRLEVLG